MLEIREISITDFEKSLINDYKTLFPEDEQKNWEGVRRTYNENIEKFYSIVNNMKIVGFIMLEKMENMPFYMDYFAIKKEYQNQGLGTNAIKMLLNDVVKENGLCIDIEKVNTEMPYTIKRASFYERLGFKKVDSTYDIFNVLYTPYYWNKSISYSKQELNKIMFNYYEINAGREKVEKYFKICD